MNCIKEINGYNELVAVGQKLFRNIDKWRVYNMSLEERSKRIPGILDPNTIYLNGESRKCNNTSTLKIMDIVKMLEGALKYADEYIKANIKILIGLNLPHIETESTADCLLILDNKLIVVNFNYLNDEFYPFDKQNIERLLPNNISVSQYIYFVEPDIFLYGYEKEYNIVQSEYYGTTVYKNENTMLEMLFFIEYFFMGIESKQISAYKELEKAIKTQIFIANRIINRYGDDKARKLGEKFDDEDGN